MSKELTPLEALNEIKDKFFVKDGNSTIGDFGLLRRLDIIETALKDYEKQHQIDIDLLGSAYKTNVQNEKKLKALEIIKKGCPYISLEKQKCINYDKPYELIIGGGYETAYIELTQEEYDLLKEVLL